MKYTTAEHRGGLKECLETEIPITIEEVRLNLITQRYEYYGYDIRIRALRFILKDHKNTKLPMWMHIYLE